MQKSKNKSIILTSIIFLLIFFTFRYILTLFFRNNLDIDKSEDIIGYTIYIGIIEFFLIIIIFLIEYVQKNKTLSVKTLGLSLGKNFFENIGKGTLIALLFLSFSLIIQILIGTSNFLHSGFMHNPPKWIFKTLIFGFFISLFVSLGEEIVFRGYFFNQFRENQKIIKALLFSSLIFMIAHIGKYFIPLQLISVFCMGILYGMVYIVFKSLWASIFMHFIYDFFVLSVIGGQLNYIDSSRLFIFRIEPYRIIIYNFIKKEIYIGNSNDIIMIVLSLFFSFLLYNFYRKRKIQ